MEDNGVYWCDDCSAFYYLTPAQKAKRDAEAAKSKADEEETNHPCVNP